MYFAKFFILVYYMFVYCYLQAYIFVNSAHIYYSYYRNR